MIDNLREKLSYLRLTVWKQTNLNGQANLDHDSVEEVLALIRTEKLKLLDKFENDCKYNYTTFGNSERMLQVSGLLKRIEAERTKLEAEL